MIENDLAAAHTSRSPALQCGLLAVSMLATPLILFAIGVIKDSVLLVDSSGALFGIDTVLLIWLRDQPGPHP
jgi:hypothetical protein